MKKNTLFILFILIIALIIGIWRDNRLTPTQNPVLSIESLATGSLLVQPKKLPAFELINTEGKPFTLDSLKGHWSFVFFGYSSCPNICPVSLTTLHQIYQRLSTFPYLQFIFISLDPIHDSKERLKDYLHQSRFINTPFIGVTGEQKTVLELAQALSLHIELHPETEKESIEHTNSILLINPQVELAAIFTSDKAHAIAHDFKEIVHRYQSLN